MSQMAGVRLAEKQDKDIQGLVDDGLYLSVSEFIRDAVREKLEAIKVLEVRDVSRGKAKEEIVEFLKTQENAYPSDIADGLRLDFDLVLSIVKELIKEGRVK